jgi:hypothetical protein
MGELVLSLAVIAAVPYAIAVSRLRRPSLPDFFIAGGLLRWGDQFTERIARVAHTSRRLLS